MYSGYDRVIPTLLLQHKTDVYSNMILGLYEMGLKILACNLCGSPDSKVFWVENGMNVVRCNNCGFSYSQAPPTGIVEPKDKAEAAFKKWERKTRVYSQVLKLLKGKRGGSLVDVGCSTGNFMLSCKREGFQPIVGVEICETRARFASGLGLTVFNCRLEEAALPDQSFDVITYLETLEHICTPVNELREANRILRDGGVIVVEVPNLTFQLFKVKVSRFLHIGHFCLMPDFHVAHFTDRTMRETLAKAGFERIETTIRTHYLREELPMLFKVFSIMFCCFAKLVRWVCGLSIGSAIIAIAQKGTGTNNTDFRL